MPARPDGRVMLRHIALRPLGWRVPAPNPNRNLHLHPVFKPTCARCGLATHPKAPEDWRTPGRFAPFASRQTTRQRLGLPRRLSGPLLI